MSSLKFRLLVEHEKLLKRADNKNYLPNQIAFLYEFIF